MMLESILIPLVTIGLAELGDKTQLSIFLLSSRVKNHVHMLLGVMLAFLLVDGTAVLAGSWITGIVPIGTVKVASGIMFVLFGALMLKGSLSKRQGKNKDEKQLFKSPFLSGFTMIAMMEWGDKTQISSGLLATKYDASMVMLGTMIALALLSVAAVYLGKFISDRMDKKLIARIAGSVFVLMGLSFFFI